MPRIIPDISDMMKAFLAIAVALALAAQPSTSFAPLSLRFETSTSASTSTSLGMGLFDGFKKAFSNEEYGAPPDAVKATARHILVKTPELAQEVVDKMAGGAPFASLASEYSTCPSGARGGSLGSFAPGVMVPEFDKAIFNPDTKVGELIGPVETKFGYHLIVVDKRTGGGDWY